MLFRKMRVFFHLAVLSAAANCSWAFATFDHLENLSQRLDNFRNELSPHTQVFSPSDKNWTMETTQRYTTHGSPTYIASIKPATESDVQKTVKFCSDLDIPFLATGGGHGFATTFSNLKNGIEIDLGFFRSVSVDATANTLTIGGGTHFQDVFDPLFKEGKEIQTGSCPCIGMLGATLGGGVGRYSGYHGMIIDSLLAVRIVTADGRITLASQKQNSDLFWAIRGAGMNYGIILSATYRVHDQTVSHVTNVDIDFPLSQSRTLMNWLKDHETTMPIGLSPTLLIGYSTERKEATFTLNVVYIGPKQQAESLLRPLLTADHIRQNVSEVPWNTFLNAPFWGVLGMGCPKGLNANLYGLAVKTFDVDTYVSMFDNWNKFVQANPETQKSVFYIEAFPTQGIRAVAEDATAYPHRDANAHLLFNFEYPTGNSSLERKVNDFAVKCRNDLTRVSGYSQLSVYVSYGHGDEPVESLYGSEKLPRLRALKKKWDGKNLFRFNEPLV